MASTLEGDPFIDSKEEEDGEFMNIHHPMEHDIVQDWNDMERICCYIYGIKQFKKSSKVHPMLLTEIFSDTYNDRALCI